MDAYEQTKLIIRDHYKGTRLQQKKKKKKKHKLHEFFVTSNCFYLQNSSKLR